MNRRHLKKFYSIKIIMRKFLGLKKSKLELKEERRKFCLKKYK